MNQTDNTTTAIATIADRAMLVSLNLSVWQARRTDKRVNAEVASTHGTSASIGNYSKSLLPNCASYEAVKTLAGDLRTTLYHYTLPWLQDGSRILLSAGFTQFSAVMKQKREAFDEAVQTFLADYPTHVEQARLDLNGLFNVADYPNEAKLRKSFSVELVRLPVPTAQDFRVQLSQDAVSLIRADIEAGLKSALAEAQRDTVERLKTALSAMADRLNDPKAIYRDSLFTNMSELVDILPTLNVLNDPSLDAIATRIKTDVLAYSPQQCRDSEPARTEAATKVDAILTLLNGANLT